MRLALSAALLFGFVACHRPSPDAASWHWFTAHQADVAQIQRADEPIAGDLARELHKVDPELTLEVGTKASPHELVISADGIQSAFPTVKRVVAAAPVIPGWTIVAFRPRTSAGSSIELGYGTTLSGADVSVHITRTLDGKLDVVFYVDRTTSLVSTAVQQAVFLLLDSTLGEYDVETRLGAIDIQPGSAAPKDARPPGELAEAVHRSK